jgi:hypothetical protein
MRSRPAAYPRSYGVLVPRVLILAGCPASTPALRPQVVAKQTAAWLVRSRRSFSNGLLDLPFPSPEVILRDWRVGRRTQGALARITKAPSSPTGWRFRDYLNVPRLGSSSVIDLLAAHEEHEQSSSEANAATVTAPIDHLSSNLDEIAAAITVALPCRPDTLSAALAATRLAPRTIRLDQIARAFHDNDRPPPFRVVRRATATLVVGRTAVTSTETLVSEAGKFIFHWGICTVGILLKRLRSLRSGGMNPVAATRILAALPRVRWLDEASEWFSMVGFNSRVQIAIAKIFGVVDRIPIRELTLGLAKRLKILLEVPEPAMERYLCEVAHCRVEGRWVRPGPEFVPAALEHGEDVVVDLIRRSGGAVARASLRALAHQAGLNLAVLHDILRSSPLFDADRAQVRLIGALHGFGAAAPA